MNKLFFFMAFLLVTTSCGSRKKAVKTPPPASDTINLAEDVQGLQKQLLMSAPQYKWLRSKGDVQYEKNNQTLSARFAIKQRQDSVVWISLNVMIEALRGMATKDSVFILNRLSKEYSVLPVSGLESVFGIPGLNLSAVQNLLVGFPPFGVADGAKINIDSNRYAVERKTASFLERFSLNTNTLRMESYFLEQNSTHRITVKYSNYKQVGGLQLPGKIELEVRSPDKILITLNVADYSMPDTDEAPFSIPSSYTRIH